MSEAENDENEMAYVRKRNFSHIMRGRNDDDSENNAKVNDNRNKNEYGYFCVTIQYF